MGTINGARLSNDECEWVRAHAALSRLASERAAADAEEGRWFLAALRSAAHVHLGFGSFGEYVERLFGYRPRTTQEKLRVAEALEGLPHLAQALEAGALSWCAARELTRVATADTERAWLEAARDQTIRQLEELGASRRPGDEPTSTPRDLPRPRVLRFDVAPETFALFREAMQQLRRSAGTVWDDDAVLLSMARHVLGGPGEDGRSSYQVSLTVCAACGSGQQRAGTFHVDHILSRARAPLASYRRAAGANAGSPAVTRPGPRPRAIQNAARASAPSLASSSTV